MGIKGLKSYIRNRKNDIIENINLCDEIRKWKIEHETNEPIILIDLKGWGFNMLHLDAWNVALGVRSNNFNKRFLKCFQKMSEAGAKFVFFVVGRKKTDDKYCTEIQSRITEFDSEYRRYIQMMDAIENETEFLPNIHDLLNYTKSNIEYMCRDLGELRVSHSLHNWEIAEYLCNQPVMAIITDDSDFMAIDGEFEYWSLGNINFDTMDGARYNKDQLNSKLDLIHQRVHSVDVLTGSDSTPFNFDSEFRELLNRLTSWYAWKNSRNLPKESELMEFCKTKYPIVYMLRTYEFFEIAEIVAVDFRMFRIHSYADMVVPVVMKLCGIVSKDEPSRPQTRTIFAKFAHEESAAVRHEEIIYPSMELPSTYELIANPEDNDYDEYRWSLLGWVLNLNHDIVTKIRLMKQPNNIKVAVISLQYLFQHQEIRPEEAYIVLLTEIQINQKENDPKEIGFVIYPKMPNVAYVRMAHLYPKIYIWMNRCLVVCGLSSITDLVRFDGPLYHNLMEKFDDANATEKDDLVSKAKAIWTFDNN